MYDDFALDDYVFYNSYDARCNPCYKSASTFSDFKGCDLELANLCNCASPDQIFFLVITVCMPIMVFFVKFGLLGDVFDRWIRHIYKQYTLRYQYLFIRFQIFDIVVRTE